MAKEADDEQVKDDIIPGEQDNEQEQPKDVRGAIRAAMDEVNEDVKEEKEFKEEKESKPIDERKRRKEQSTSEEVIAKDKESKEEKKEVKEEVKIDPPPFYKTKGKAVWDKLSPEDRQFLVTREKEVSDGFAQVSQRIKGVENIERAIAPRLQAIQQYGVEPAVVVDRLFQWMEGLNNPSTKLSTFKELAKSFGVNPNQLFPQQTNGTETEVTNEQLPSSNEPPEWFNEFTGQVQQKIGNLEQTISTQQSAAAANVINNWAKDKPHYGTVGRLMGQLIQSGVVPLTADGNVDLDGAYNAAIKLHPEVQSLIQQEATDKAAQEAQEKAEKEAKEKADRLAKAKKAGSGIKPAARSIAVAPLNQKTVNGAGKSASVRDSIKAAIEEARE
jgi:hypothetical protein